MTIAKMQILFIPLAKKTNKASRAQVSIQQLKKNMPTMP
jgi:hypothetical protein